MFYFGGDGNEVSLSESAPPTVGANMRIGLALSNDGVHWGRVEGEHSSGAVLEPQQGQTFIGWPQARCRGRDGLRADRVGEIAR
eukprot:6178866-Pleurochrysis_carterae.AAC.2